MSGDEKVPEIFERVIKAFQKHEQIAKESTRLEIAESLKEFKHFKALTRQDNCLDYFYAAIPLLKYQRIRKRDFVFHHSDRGGVFYFILKGKAGVLVPKSPEVVAKEVELNAIIINCGNQITKTNIPEEKAMLEADRAIALKQLTAMRDPYSEDLMSKQKIRYFKDEGRVCLFRQVNTLKSMDSFGEVSIVSNKKLRTASVISEDDELHVLSITGENYIAVFDQELSRLNFTLRVLEETFTNASRDSIVRLAYEFKEMVLDKHQIIVKEGQPAKQVFLVKSGEIEITKDIKKPQVASFFNIKGNTQTKVTKTPNKFVRKFELKSQIIAILGAEAFFGLDESPFYQFSARSGSNNSVVFGIDRQLLENYNVWKLLQKRSAMKNQFYSERFDKLMEFEEQQDVQRAQPRRPDYQSLLNAGRKAHPELVDSSEKDEIRRSSVLINLNSTILKDNNSTLEKSNINNIEKMKKNNIDRNAINSEESKQPQQLNKNTDISMNLREQVQGSFSVQIQESQLKNSKDHSKLDSNKITTSLPDFQGLPGTEKSIGSEQIFQTQIVFPTNNYPSSTCETLRQYPLETVRFGLKDNQPGEAQQHGIQITEGNTQVEEEEEIKRKIISEESESELIKDQGVGRQENEEKQQEGEQQHQQRQKQQREQYSLQQLDSQKHKKLKFRWSNILSETKTIPQNQYHHKATSLSLNTIYHKAPQDNGTGHKKKENSVFIGSNEEEKQKMLKPLSQSQIIVNSNQQLIENYDEIVNNQPTTADNNTRPRMNSWNEMSSIEHHVKYANEKTAQNVSSLHSFSNKNNQKNLLNNTTNILIDNAIQEGNQQTGIISPHTLLHFGEEKRNSKPIPKIQFKLVIQDLLEKKNMGETFNYFRKGKDAKIGAMWSTDEENQTDLKVSFPERHLSTKDISRFEKIKKKSDGIEGQIETLSVKDRIGQTLTYNKTVLEQKKLEQLVRLQDSMEQEKADYLKLQKHAVIRQSKRRHDDFLQGAAGSQIQCNQVMLKLNQGQEEDPLSQIVCLPKQFQQQQQQQQRRNTTNQTASNQQSQSISQTQIQQNLQISIKSLPHLFQSVNRAKISGNSPKSTFSALKNKENHRNSSISSNKTYMVTDSRRLSDCMEQQTMSQPLSSQPAMFTKQIQSIHSEYQIDNQLGRRYMNNSPNDGNLRSNSKINNQIAVANHYFMSSSKQQHHPQIDHQTNSVSTDKQNNNNSFDAGSTENPDYSQQNQEKQSIKTGFSEELKAPNLVTSYNYEKTDLEQIDNSKTEIAQLQLFAQMHLNKSTRMQFYKSKPNFHLLDQKKIKNTSSSKERDQSGRVNTSVIPSLAHSSLFPVIHSFNNITKN